MSSLNPGGQRGGHGRFGCRVYGAGNIKRAIADNLKGKSHDASGSIAGEAHTHSREVARRLRQQAKKENTPCAN